MKKISIVIFHFLFLFAGLAAQKDNLVTVKAGTRLLDYFPLKERYLYPEFGNGQLIFKNGLSSPGLFNYNILLGEIEFIKSHDTLTIINKKDISFITVAQDTFFYENGYIELIDGGPVRIGLMQKVRLKEIERKGAYGLTDRNSAIETYSTWYDSGNYYELIPDQNLILEKEKTYFISTRSNGFVLFTRKNSFEIVPQKKKLIKNFLKSNKIDFSSDADLLKVADFLETLLERSS